MKSRLVVCALLLGTGACVTVRPVAAPAAFIPQHTPEFVWVEQNDGELYQVSRPTLRGDTLQGMRVGTSEPVNLALPQIRSISARQLHRTRTTLFVATATALAGFIVWRAIGSGSTGSNCQYLTDNHVWICP